MRVARVAAFGPGHMPLSPGTRLGPYEIAALIGAGGMGEVYRARDTNLKRDVAIKILPDYLAGDAERLARFRREAETLAALNHQSIAHVYGLEGVGTTTGFVMELVEGPTLAERIEEGALPFAEALPIALQIADALEAAHERAIVHRDLKPANVKLRADGTVKVLDFGIAKALQPIATASGPETLVANTPSMTQMGTILGTAAYMSPEQARGKPVDRRTDIWAFGCVLYEMLSGRPAFDGDDATITIGRVLEREVDMTALPAAVPPVVGQTLKACLQKDAKKRLRDIGDVRLALEGAFEPQTQGQRAPRRSAWRQRAAIATAFAGGIAVFGLAAWRLWPAPEPRAVTRLAEPIDMAERLISISRDGRRIGYRGGDRSVHVRDLDAFDARVMPGTSGSAAEFPPCFSPDGVWIAFTSSGQQLRRMPVSGGPALTVAQGLTGADLCDWGDDGYIYVGTNAGIVRVRESGGETEVVAAPSAERNEASYDYPRVLPGGTRLLYVAYGSEALSSARVEALDLTTRERKTVVDGATAVTYVRRRSDPARGFLVYGTREALFASPFDPDRLEVGAARPIASDVVGLGWISSGVVSESGTLAYLSGTATIEGDATMIFVDRDGTEHAVPEPPRLYGEVSFSPDGRQAVLAIQEESATSANLWIYELESGQITPLTFGGANTGARWTADGDRVIYFHESSLIGGQGRSEMRTVSVDNSDQPISLVSSAPWMRGIVQLTSVSAGALLVTNDSQAEADVLAFDLDELSPGALVDVVPRELVVTPYRERNAVLSPDGRFVAYTSNDSGRDEVYVVPYRGSGGKSLVSRGGGVLPRWSPAGQELFYLSGDSLMSVAVETSAVFRAATPRKLFTIPPLVLYRGVPYDVLPDGSRFLMLKLGSSSQQVELRVVVNWIDELEREEPDAQR